MTVLTPSAHRNDLDMCASSVSSAELSTPPRPDSPRLVLADSTAVLTARLRQLQVWGDAAEEEREDQHEQPSFTQTPQLDKPPKDRLADRTRPSSYNLGSDFVPGLSRRKSLFCARPKSDNPEMTRKPSLWAFASRSSMSLSPTSCSSLPRRPSFRRRGSFHRYARISGHRTLPDRKDPSSFDSDFDDLSEGLDATKVTETPIEGH